MLHGHLDYFQSPPLKGRPNTKPRDHASPNAHNRWFIISYHVWRPAWIDIRWTSIRVRVQSHMTLHYTRGSVTTLHNFESLGTACGHSLLNSHNFMVTALGSCVKWPLDVVHETILSSTSQYNPSKTISSNSITSVIQFLHPFPTLNWPSVWPWLIQ